MQIGVAIRAWLEQFLMQNSLSLSLSPSIDLSSKCNLTWWCQKIASSCWQFLMHKQMASWSSRMALHCKASTYMTLRPLFQSLTPLPDDTKVTTVVEMTETMVNHVILDMLDSTITDRPYCWGAAFSHIFISQSFQTKETTSRWTHSSSIPIVHLKGAILIIGSLSSEFQWVFQFRNHGSPESDGGSASDFSLSL